MGIYSVKGSDAFDARLDRDFQTVARALAESDVGALCRALVLLGVALALAHRLRRLR